MTLNVEALNEVGRIFDWRPDPARYFASAAAEQVRHGLLEALASGHGVLVLVGEAGAGKTLLVNTVVQTLPAQWAHVAQLSFTVLSGQELASSIAYALGMPPGPSVMSHQSPREWIETQLRVWASCDESSLLVVDEAQNLPLDALHTLLELNQIRLNGRSVLRVVLVGQPDVLRRLEAAALPTEGAAHAVDIAPHFLVPPLTPRESAEYLEYRLSQYTGPTLPALTPQALTEIHARAQGRPGRINVLCQQLLHSAILLESYDPIDGAAVAAQADELLYYADPNATAKATPTQAPEKPEATPEERPKAKPRVELTPAVLAIPSAPMATATPLAEAPVAAPASSPAEAVAAEPTLLPKHPAPPKQIAVEPLPLDAIALDDRPAPRPASSQALARRLVAWSAGSLAMVLVAGVTWFYVQRPSSPSKAIPTTVMAPATAPSVPSEPSVPAAPVATPPAAADPAIATETSETPDPQTQALLSAPAAAPASPPLPKELPHAPPLETQPAPTLAATTPTVPKGNAEPNNDNDNVNVASTPTAAKVQPPSSVLQPTPRPGAQLAQQQATPPAGAPSTERPVAKTTNAQCTNLLAQMSLGEPLNAKQLRVLQTQCR
jgi:general secretion pathway protein A